jgi:hypothetical protein
MSKEIKDKAYLFKSQKYIKDFRSTSVLGGDNNSSLIVKKEERK